jgi:hypothetical protein
MKKFLTNLFHLFIPKELIKKKTKKEIKELNIERSKLLLAKYRRWKNSQTTKK